MHLQVEEKIIDLCAVGNGHLEAEITQGRAQRLTLLYSVTQSISCCLRCRSARCDYRQEGWWSAPAHLVTHPTQKEAISSSTMGLGGHEGLRTATLEQKRLPWGLSSEVWAGVRLGPCRTSAAMLHAVADEVTLEG